MSVVPLHDRAALRAYLEGDAFLHLYELGDLDDALWPHTRYLGHGGDGPLHAACLLFTAAAPPVLLAFASDGDTAMAPLLADAAPGLPDAVYGHISAPLLPSLSAHYDIQQQEAHLKMALVGQAYADTPIPTGYALRPLSEADMPAMLALYEVAYPHTWFEPSSLERGPYVGLVHGGELVAIAGVHVYSRATDVAALGNITTHPKHRGRGLGAAVTAALCRMLTRDVGRVGLNVHRDNAAARRCYEKLGFEVCAAYEEVSLRRGDGA